MKSKLPTKYFQISAFVIIVIFFGLIVLKNINSPLSRWDEATNVQVVSENQNKNILEPLSLNGEPFLEKPPVWYELTIISTKLFGFNLFSLRLVSLVSTTILIGSITFFVFKKFDTNASIVSLATLVFSPILFFKFDNPFSQHTMLSADLDSLFILLIFLSHFFIYKISERKLYIFLAGLTIALSFLTKGPFAFLPLLIYLVVNIYLKNKLNWKRLGIVLFTSIILIMSWNIFMFSHYSNIFINEFYGYHLLGRGISSVEGHNNSPFFFATIFLNPTLFSTGISSVILVLKNRSTKDLFVAHVSFASRIIFIASLLIQTKLSWYILPLYFYVSLINSQIIFEEKKLRILLILQLVFGLIISTANILL